MNTKEECLDLSHAQKRITYLAFILGVDDFYKKDVYALVKGIVEICTGKTYPSYVKKSKIEKDDFDSVVCDILEKRGIKKREYKNLIDEYSQSVNEVDDLLKVKLGVGYSALNGIVTNVEKHFVIRLSLLLSVNESVIDYALKTVL